jgi:hypothetical protein
MQMTHAAPTATDLKSTLEELRASVAAEGTQKGVAGLVQEACLKMLAVLVALLLDFRAGRLAPLVVVAEEAGGAGDAAVSNRKHP